MEYNIAMDAERCTKIGDRIRAERKALKWTQAEMEAKLREMGAGVGHNTYVYIERGGIEKISFAMLCALTQIFNCDAGYLLCEDGYEGKSHALVDVSKELGLKYETVEDIKNYDVATKGFLDILANDKLAGTSTLKALLYDILLYSTYTANEVRLKDYIMDKEIELTEDEVEAYKLNDTMDTIRTKLKHIRILCTPIRNRLAMIKTKELMAELKHPKEKQIDGQMDISEFI